MTLARRLALAAARADGAYRDDGHLGLDHAGPRPDEPEVGAGREDGRSLVHDVLVGDVAVGENHLVGVSPRIRLAQLGLGVDRDALRIARPGQLRGIATALDVRDLGGGEGHDLGLGVIAEDRVEIVEITSRGAHDYHARRQAILLWRRAMIRFAFDGSQTSDA